MITKVAHKFDHIRKPQEVFTTGDVARIAGVAARTASKWIDSGQLQGYRIPRSRDRRVPRDSLVKFLQANDMPLGELAHRALRVLLIGVDGQLAEQIAQRDPEWECHSAQDAIAAAFAAGMIQPDVLVIDFVIHRERAMRLAEQLKATCGRVVVGVTSEPGPCPAGFDDLFHLPCDPELLAARIWSLTERRQREAT